ncbi:MAG: hypothetical protein E6Q62_03160 [Nitrosomonas sp.]|nr:MAG: hypothetical protein E6Q62_03160 [Nitrosomonas sp.]
MQHSVIQKIINTGVAALLTIFSCFHAFAHNPHDPVYALGVSPNFANDKTLFLSTDGEITTWRYPDILRSTDGGITWTALPWGMDNRISVFAIRVSPGYRADRTVFVATGNGIYKSSNRGNFWQPFSEGLSNNKYIVKMEIAGSENNYVLFSTAGDGSLYRRTNTETAWKQVFTESADINIIAASPNFSQNQTVIAGNISGAIKLSTDGGLTWVDKGNPTGATLYKIAIAPGTAREIFLATSNGIYVSNDLGDTYTARSGNLPVEGINNIAFSPNYQTDRTLFCTTLTKAVYKSTNGGTNWVFQDSTAHITGQITLPNEFSQLQVSNTFSSDQAVFLSAFDGLFISNNGGRTWIQSKTRDNLITGLAISPNFATDETVMTTTYHGGGFYTSTDKGATWSLKSANWPNNTGFLSAFDITFAKNSSLAVATLNESFIGLTTNFGESWNVLPLPLFPDVGTGPVYPITIGLSPAYQTDEEIFIGTRAPHSILKTSDGGINWQLTPNPPIMDHITSLALSPNYGIDKTAFAVNKIGEVWRTQNSGNTWTRVGATSVLIQGKQSYMWVAISPQYAADRLVLVGTNNGIYRSGDGGNSWKPFLHQSIGTGKVIQQIEFSPTFAQDRAVVVNVRGKGLYRLTLNSTGWIAASQSIGQALISKNIQFTEFQLSPNFNQDATILGVSRRNVYMSTDNGINWITMGSPGSE